MISFKEMFASLRSAENRPSQSIPVKKDRVAKLATVLQTIILNFLTPEEVAITSRVNKSWKMMSLQDQDALWKRFYKERYDCPSSQGLTWQQQFAHNENEVLKVWQLIKFPRFSTSNQNVYSSQGFLKSNEKRVRVLEHYNESESTAYLYLDKNGKIKDVSIKEGKILNSGSFYLSCKLTKVQTYYLNKDRSSFYPPMKHLISISSSMHASKGFFKKNWNYIESVADTNEFLTQQQSKNFAERIICWNKGLNAKFERMIQNSVKHNLEILSNKIKSFKEIEESDNLIFRINESGEFVKDTFDKEKIYKKGQCLIKLESCCSGLQIDQIRWRFINFINQPEPLDVTISAIPVWKYAIMISVMEGTVHSLMTLLGVNIQYERFKWQDSNDDVKPPPSTLEEAFASLSDFHNTIYSFLEEDEKEDSDEIL